MANWVTCTTVADGSQIRVNFDHVALVRPHNRDRGGTGSEITFVGGSPSTIVVKEGQDHLTGGTRAVG